MLSLNDFQAMKPGGFKKKKKNADFKKPLEIVPKLKRAQSHHFGVFGTKEDLYIITRNLCKNGELPS